MNLDKRLLREASRVRLEFTMTVSLGFLGGILTVLQARYFAKLVNGAFLGKLPLSALWGTVEIIIGVILLRSIVLWASEVSAARMAGVVKQELRDRLFSHILKLGPAYAHSERTGELTNTAVEGIEALDAYFSQYIPQLALAALIPLTIFIFVLTRDRLSAFVLLVTAPMIPIFMMLIGSIADWLTRKQWNTLSRMSAHFLDVLQGLTTLKILGRSKEQTRVIAEISDKFRRTTLGVLRVAFLSALVLELVATISTAIAAVEIGLRLLYGHMEFEQAFFVLLLAPEFYLPLRLLGTRFHAGMSGVAAARRIFEVLETPVPEPPATVLPHVPADLRFDVSFTNVHYAYEDGKRPALKSVSFEIVEGSKTALVGPSGAGKSTVASLLLRFISPDEGEILVGDIPLRNLPVEGWREKVAWVPQNPYLFHGTVADNIRLARPDATEDEVKRAAALAHVSEFIPELPQGYDTIVGERGARLSGGQAQRIALARAFLKDAPFLILDEATSNLDPENEALIEEATKRLMEGRTVLIIAHRLSTVMDADKIVVLSGGKVQEIGTHEDLLSHGGIYARMVTLYGGAA